MKSVRRLMRQGTSNAHSRRGQQYCTIVNIMRVLLILCTISSFLERAPPCNNRDAFYYYKNRVGYRGRNVSFDDAKRQQTMEMRKYFRGIAILLCN